MNKKKIQFCFVPDYVSVDTAAIDIEHCVIAGDAGKVPEHLKVYDFMDISNQGIRMLLMGMVPDIAQAVVLSPAVSFYRKVMEYDDNDFCADLVQRLLLAGAKVQINSGLVRDRITKPAAQWIRAAAGMGIEMQYREEIPETKLKNLIIAKDIEECEKTGKEEIHTAPKAIITPGAIDEANRKGIIIIRNRGGQL